MFPGCTLMERLNPMPALDGLRGKLAQGGLMELTSPPPSIALWADLFSRGVVRLCVDHIQQVSQIMHRAGGQNTARSFHSFDWVDWFCTLYPHTPGEKQKAISSPAGTQLTGNVLSKLWTNILPTILDLVFNDVLKMLAQKHYLHIIHGTFFSGTF